MERIMEFETWIEHKRILLNEEALWRELPNLSKNAPALKSKLESQIQAAKMTADEFRKGLEALHRGDSKLSKEAVKVLQMILGLAVDGAYGAKTKEAVREFQDKSLGFSSENPDKWKRTDGLWGPNTAKAAFGDAKTPRSLSPLLTFLVDDDKSGQAAISILTAMSGVTEDEDAVYNTFKTLIKTKEDYEKLENLWKRLNVNAISLRSRSGQFYKGKKISDIVTLNATLKNPLTLGQLFAKYFSDSEISRLNSYLPAGVEKF
jgi:hypothetical protein